MKLSKIYVPVLLLFVGILCSSLPDTPPQSRTGAPGEESCFLCHAPSSGSGLIEIIGVPTGDIEPNTTYPIMVRLTNFSPNRISAGFELVVIEGNEPTSGSVGTFSNLGPKVGTITPSPGVEHDNRTYLRHFGGEINFMSNVINYTADWTSPDTINDIHFYAAGVIANGDGLGNDFVRTTSIDKIPLPVELLDFKVKQIGTRQAEITWETATETNSDYFEVLRSTNGKDYEILEKISAAGFSNQHLSYSYIDEHPLVNHTALYRLKQVDTNGKFVYSSIQPLQVLDFNENKMTLLPNPVAQGECIFIDFLAIKNYPNAVVQLLDVSGRAIFDVKFRMLPNGLVEGFNKIMVDTNGLPCGMYFIKVQDGRAILSSQSVVIH